MRTPRVIDPHPPFDYGTSVRWQRGTTSIVGSICGFRRIDDARPAADTGMMEEAVLALVELQSGETVEVPLTQLDVI